MTYALLFSGQGLQHPAMLPWLGDAAWRAGLEDAEAAARNASAQPLLTGLALTAWERLSPLLPAPAAVAGYSVGELAAFAAAGVFDTKAAVALARERAAAMDQCAAGQPPTGLLGVSGLAPAPLRALCERFGLVVAIRSDAATVVLGGERPALAEGAEAVVQAGGHATPLRVALASHTPWMHDAARHFATVLEAAPMAAPRTALFSNFTGGRLSGAAGLRAALAGQIAHTVRWDEAMDGIAERGVRCVLEIGAGSALARLWNKRFADIPARSADEFQSLEILARWVLKSTA